MKEKAVNYSWACSVLQKLVEDATYGSVTFSMQNGIIGNMKLETVSKPPVDNHRANP